MIEKLPTKVSVLMPIYNTEEEHLREAIESILSQTYQNFEFLILNDSPDNSRLDEIVNSYDDKRIKYTKNAENVGITQSRNKLIELSQGEYLAVMDHDDISLPTRFAKQIQILESRPEIGVVSSWVDTIAGTKLYFPDDDKIIKELLMDICAVVHPASMIRKSVLLLNNLQYEEEYSPSEDYRLWCQLIGVTRFYNIQDVLFRYRDHMSRTSERQKQRMADVTRDIHAQTRERYHEIAASWTTKLQTQPNWYAEYVTPHESPQEAEPVSPTIEAPPAPVLGNGYEQYRVMLFTFIPLIRVDKYQHKVKVYLFSILPILSVRRKSK